jgi:hypothetical protein
MAASADGHLAARDLAGCYVSLLEVLGDPLESGCIEARSGGLQIGQVHDIPQVQVVVVTRGDTLHDRASCERPERWIDVDVLPGHHSGWTQ